MIYMRQKTIDKIDNFIDGMLIVIAVGCLAFLIGFVILCVLGVFGVV